MRRLNDNQPLKLEFELFVLKFLGLGLILMLPPEGRIRKADDLSGADVLEPRSFDHKAMT